MDIKKWLKIAAIVVAVVVFGGILYEAIVGWIGRGRDVELIATLRADNADLDRRLVDSENIVADGLVTIIDLKQGNRDLGDELAASKLITNALRTESARLGERLGSSLGDTGRLRSDNHNLREELERSDSLAGSLAEENRRLGEALGSSVESAESIAGTHRELRDAIERAWDIVERYSGSTEDE